MLNKRKYFFLAICLFILIFTCYEVFKSSKTVDIQKLQIDRELNENLISGVKIDNFFGIYNSNDNAYYFSCRSDKIDSIKVFSPYKIKYYIKKESDNKYSIFIYSSKYYNYITIYFNNISYISINNMNYFNNLVVKENSLFKKNFLFENQTNSLTEEYFVSSSSNYKKYGLTMYDSLNSIGTMRERGRTSLSFLKKSYKVELNNSYSLLGMGKDDDWILDALYTDSSKVRNKLSYDLWNLINDNQVINNDLHGEFVEMYLNYEYNGLYVLKEKVDKKATNVSTSGVLLKSVMYDADNIVANVVNGSNLLFNRFEVKYGSEEDLSNFINKYIYYYQNPSDYNNISDVFYIDNFVNYKIFLSLIYGSDNLSKNQYWSLSNKTSKILITPWDMDLTWGLVWSDDSLLRSKFYMDGCFDIKWMDEYIFNVDIKTRNVIKNRYWELRKNVITMDTINGYLDSYKELLVNSGAAKRDSERWYEYDVEFEIEQIREWARRRIEFLDEYFK